MQLTEKGCVLSHFLASKNIHPLLFQTLEQHQINLKCVSFCLVSLKFSLAVNNNNYSFLVVRSASKFHQLIKLGKGDETEILVTFILLKVLP